MPVPMAKRSHKSRRPGDLRDVIKRIRQLYGAFCLWVSVQIAQLVTQVEDDAVTSIDNFPPLARLIFGSRLLFGVWSAQPKACPAIITCRFQVVCGRIALRLVTSGDEKYGNSVGTEALGSGDCGCLLLVDPIVPVLRNVTPKSSRNSSSQLERAVSSISSTNASFSPGLALRARRLKICESQVTLPIQV
jgi:hypothetical protein